MAVADRRAAAGALGGQALTLGDQLADEAQRQARCVSDRRTVGSGIDHAEPDPFRV